MTRKIAVIPVDARPVTYDMPVDLGKLAGWEVVVPHKDILGYLKDPADLEKLFAWMTEVAPQVEGMVVSVDMVLYGGLVPSRINLEQLPVILERLQRFLEVKKANPALQLMLFSSTMRISNNYVNVEEKDYWSQYGKEIWSFSYHWHRYKRLGMEEDRLIYEQMNAKIPAPIMEDYQWTRERNFQVNLSLIDAMESAGIDLLVFPQDDTSEFGFNIMEQEQLKRKILEENLFDKVLIYPGADEVSSLLAARLIYTLEGKPFPTYYPIYSGLKGALTTARYEDRTIQESVKGQIFALGSQTVEDIQEADVVLGVNVPGERQGEIALQQSLLEVDTNNRNVGEWIRKLRYYANKGKPVAIVDVAYANGADVTMMPQLLSHFSLIELAGFAAWNTAGNTIGTVVAQSALILLAEEKGLDMSLEKESVLLTRLLDDYLYQSVVRQTVRAEVDENHVSSQELLEVVKTHFIPEANQLLEKVHAISALEAIYLPWDRTFEIGIRLKTKAYWSETL